jgi:peroxiredoxin
MDIELKPFKGNNIPTPFTLNDINDETISLDDIKGKVTIVNFWATWCPPCVEEIPSLNRLTKKMHGKPFRLISINYAESKSLISDFLKRVNVEFPVLLDRKGEVSEQWNVIAFPSTFVIGPDGKIHYGINAAIAWDDPVVITKLNALMGQ